MKHRSLALALGAAIASGTAFSQPAPDPSQPVKLVVGFAAGGPSDLVARAFADQAAKGLGQPVVVENRPGANAVLATSATVLVVGPSMPVKTVAEFLARVRVAGCGC